MVEQAEQVAPELDDAPQPAWLNQEEQDAWLGAAAIFLKLPGVLDAQLQRDAGLNLFEYFVLSSLSMAEGRSLRMSELAGLINGSLSRLSNVAKRLEQRGWMTREPDPDNGRYTRAHLTDTGWEQVVAAAPGHVAAVRQFLVDPLTSTQLRTLAIAGQRIVQRIAEEPRCVSECEPPSGC